MNDLISRQAAVDAINHICPVDTEYDCALLDRVDVRYVLSDLPSAQPEQRWIPVSERLPDGRLNKSYLVQDKDGRLAVGTYMNWGWMFGHYMNDPVAWMPLPKPYETERKENG